MLGFSHTERVITVWTIENSQIPVFIQMQNSVLTLRHHLGRMSGWICYAKHRQTFIKNFGSLWNWAETQKLPSTGINFNCTLLQKYLDKVIILAVYHSRVEIKKCTWRIFTSKSCEQSSVPACSWGVAFSFAFSMWNICPVGFCSSDWHWEWREFSFFALKGFRLFSEHALGHCPSALQSAVQWDLRHLAEYKQII